MAPVATDRLREELIRLAHRSGGVPARGAARRGAGDRRSGPARRHDTRNHRRSGPTRRRGADGRCCRGRGQRGVGVAPLRRDGAIAVAERWLAELTAVPFEPARPQELAPLIAAAYGLTARERTVT